jgi:hypothetical protein
VTFPVLDFGGSLRLEDVGELERSHIEIFDASGRTVHDDSVYSDLKYALIWLWRESILCAIEHYRRSLYKGADRKRQEIWDCGGSLRAVRSRGLR